MATSLEQFARQIAECGAVSAEELRALLAALPPAKQPLEAQELARLLVSAGKLTKYQAAQIYSGKGKELVFGKYVLLDKLGQGGMGQVFKARHGTMQRVVALKVLSPEAMKSPEAVQRFRREARAAAKLNHPNIVTAFDADQAGNVHYLVMECVEGQDLNSLVKQNGRLKVADALDYVLQAATGLAYAHSQGVIHRDIKPHNLLLDASGVVKILDMGLARFDEGADSAKSLEGLTQSGVVMGTVDYMAPEQAEDSRQADARADIYSLGCTLFRLLSGSTPYQGATAVHKLLAHREKAIPSLRAEREDVPPELDAICQRMMAKRADDRYAKIEHVLADLKACQAGKPLVHAHVAPRMSGDSQLSLFLTGMSPVAPPGSTQVQMGPTIASRRPISARRKRGLLDQPRTWGVGAGVVALAVVGVLLFRLREQPALKAVANQPVSGKPQPELTWPKPAVETPAAARPPQPQVVPAVAAPKTNVPAAVLAQSAPSNPVAISLLPLIDTTGDRVHGQWSRNDAGEISSNAVANARIHIPYQPPAEFDLRIEFTRTSGNDGMTQILVAGGKPFRCEIGGYGNKVLAFETVDGKPGSSNSTTASKAAWLETGRRCTSLVEVRKDGLKAYLDGTLVTKLTTDYSNLGILPTWSLTDLTVLGLGAYNSPMIFHRVEVTEVSGVGTFTRPDDPAARAAESRRSVAALPPEALAENGWGRFAPGSWTSGKALTKVAGKSFEGTTKETLLENDGQKFVVENNFSLMQKPFKITRLPGQLSILGGGNARELENGLNQFKGQIRTLGEESLNINGRTLRTKVIELTASVQGQCMNMKVWFSAEVPGAFCRKSELAGTVQVEWEATEFEVKEQRAAANFALDFGAPQAHVAIPSWKFKGDHPLTLEAWVFWRTVKKAFVVSDIESAGIGLALSEPGYEGKWAFVARDQKQYRLIAANDAAPLGKWMHLAAVLQDGVMRLFIDGRLQQQTATLNGSYKASAPVFMIGAQPTAGKTAVDSLNGLIDEVRISRIARYSSDFTPEATFQVDGNTVALYRCDEGQGDQLVDSSGNGHHGVMKKARWVASDGRTAAIPSWRSLFNGQDLSGWTSSNPKDAGSVKVVTEAGSPTLLLTSPMGITTSQAYGDYHLRFEYKVVAGAGGGVHVFSVANTIVQLSLSPLNRTPPDLAILLTGISGEQADVRDGRIVGLGQQLNAEKAVQQSIRVPKSPLTLDPGTPWQRLEVIRLGDAFLFLANGRRISAITGTRSVEGAKPLGRSPFLFWTGGSSGNGPAQFRNIEIRDPNALPPGLP